MRIRGNSLVKGKGAWWVEGGELHVDIPWLLRNCGLVDIEENRDLAVKVVLELAADKLPRVPVTVLENEGW